MPTAVLDLEFNNLPAEINNPKGYERALVLLRMDGRPVGQALISLPSDQISGDELRKALLLNADSSFWENWLHNHLELPHQQLKVSDRPSATVAVCTR